MDSSSMKIIQLNVTDMQGGGAARCAWNLYQGIKERGIASEMFVMTKRSEDPSVHGPTNIFQRWYYRCLVVLNYLGILLFYRGHRGGHTLGLFPNPFLRKLSRLNPDILHIHAPACSFVPITALEKFNCPIVWTVHDLWPMVGGAHHPKKVTASFFDSKVSERCGDDSPRWIDRCIFSKKLKHWKHVPLQMVAPSHWMGQWVMASKVLSSKRVEVVPNAIDLSFFSPPEASDRLLATELYKLLGLEVEPDAFVILFGANSLVSDRNKGLDLVMRALESMSMRSTSFGKPVHVIMFGADSEIDVSRLNFEVSVLGAIQDYENMRLLYQRADVFLMASVFENLPFVIMEAMACKTPVIGVNTGGIPEMIEHKVNGFLLKERSEECLVEGIEWALSHDDWSGIGKNARLFAEQHYSMNQFIDRHLQLYQNLLKRT